MDLRLGWGAVTHPGCVRQVNQDATLAGPHVFAVADGMGGHAAGEVASSIAVATLAELGGDGGVRPTDVQSALDEANRRIADRASRDSSLAGMGTTIAGVAVGPGPVPRLTVFNVGDSRVYRFRDGCLEQLSVDHSVTAELVASGQLAPSEVAEHPERHTITRALGLEAALQVEQTIVEPASGDRYLVCSDGLTNEVADDALRELLGGHLDARTLAKELLDRALARGAVDNVSAVVVDVLDIVADVANLLDDSTAPRAAPDTTIPPRPPTGPQPQEVR